MDRLVHELHEFRKTCLNWRPSAAKPIDEMDPTNITAKAAHRSSTWAVGRCGMVRTSSGALQRMRVAPSGADLDRKYPVLIRHTL